MGSKKKRNDAPAAMEGPPTTEPIPISSAAAPEGPTAAHDLSTADAPTTTDAHRSTAIGAQICPYCAEVYPKHGGTMLSDWCADLPLLCSVNSHLLLSASTLTKVPARKDTKQH